MFRSPNTPFIPPLPSPDVAPYDQPTDWTGYPPYSQTPNPPGTPWAAPPIMGSQWPNQQATPWMAPTQMGGWGPPAPGTPWIWQPSGITANPSVPGQVALRQGRAFGPQPPTPYNSNSNRIPPFSAGPHCMLTARWLSPVVATTDFDLLDGPILDPLVVRVLHVEVRLNPLISPYTDENRANTHFLKWDMLLPTSAVQRSSDVPNVPWLAGRDEPATHPKVTMLRLVSEHFPWVITVHEAPKGRGVTCGDVIETISHELHKPTTKDDFDRLSSEQQAEVASAYRHNRSRSVDIPAVPAPGSGMRRVDYLKEDINFAGIEANDSLVRAITGENIPCTFVLKSEPSSGPLPSLPDEKLIE